MWLRMATPQKPTRKSTPAEAAKPAAPKAAGTAKRASGECVVNDGTAHVGRAVNGKVCSAHAMRYKADGTRRSA